MEPQTINFTNNGICSSCGQCCGSLLPVTDEEMRILKEYIDRRGIQPSLPEQDTFISLQCPLLQPASDVQPKARCKVYDVRPAICRAFKCDQRQDQTAALLLWETGWAPPDESRNLWSLFNMTGIQEDGYHVPWDEAPAVIVTANTGERYRFQTGQPVDMTLTDGRQISAIPVNIGSDGLELLDLNSHVMTFVSFEQIHGILSESAKYAESDDSSAKESDACDLD